MFFFIRFSKANLTVYFPQVLLMGRPNPAGQFHYILTLRCSFFTSGFSKVNLTLFFPQLTERRNSAVQFLYRLEDLGGGTVCLSGHQTRQDRSGHMSGHVCQVGSSLFGTSLPLSRHFGQFGIISDSDSILLKTSLKLISNE